MATLSIVEHLNVLKQIRSGFLPVAIAKPDDPFALEDAEEALHDRIRYLSITVPERPEASVAEHREIIDRLRAGDADASAVALREHLTNSWQIIRDVLARLG